MARYKPIDLSPKMIPVDYAQQILPGTFEYALCYLIDYEVDLAAFAALRENPVETSRLFGTVAQVVPVSEFFAPENMQRIIEGRQPE